MRYCLLTDMTKYLHNDVTFPKMGFNNCLVKLFPYCNWQIVYIKTKFYDVTLYTTTLYSKSIIFNLSSLPHNFIFWSSAGNCLHSHFILSKIYLPFSYHLSVNLPSLSQFSLFSPFSLLPMSTIFLSFPLLFSPSSLSPFLSACIPFVRNHSSLLSISYGSSSHPPPLLFLVLCFFSRYNLSLVIYIHTHHRTNLQPSATPFHSQQTPLLSTNNSVTSHHTSPLHSIFAPRFPRFALTSYHVKKPQGHHTALPQTHMNTKTFAHHSHLHMHLLLCRRLAIQHLSPYITCF